MQTNEPGIRTRSLDESLRHGHDAADRLENILDGLRGDLTGDYADPACQPARASGLVYSADTLAGRLEALTRAASEVRDRVVANNVVTVASGVAGSARAYDGQRLER